MEQPGEIPVPRRLQPNRPAPKHLRLRRRRRPSKLVPGTADTHHIHRMRGPIGKHLYHGPLKAGCDVRTLSKRYARAHSRHHLCHSRLQARETQLASRPAEHRSGKWITFRVALSGDFLQGWSPRPIEPQQLRDLIKSFPNRIINGPPELNVPTNPATAIDCECPPESRSSR